ncbi:hypothetical protein ACFXJ8_12055 [Nonomuraea sp. NPDC059194]|uniref:hypothetical protein n=1 Tax=Nonomuraea sp. NPDC059194 TaxID=3346764 RepID=UPI0036A205D0
MIRDIHITHLREQVDQARRDLAGFERMLMLAEQEARVGQVLPDPMMPVGAPWPAPPQGVHPYQPTPIDGEQLPPKQQNAFTAFEANHKELAQTPEQVREDEKWRQA